MRKLQIGGAGLVRITIQQEIVRGEESSYDQRLHGLLLATADQSCRAGQPRTRVAQSDPVKVAAVKNNPPSCWPTRRRTVQTG
jgi:hypothetical protein